MKTLISDRSDRDTFLAARKGRIGSSDIATICGLNKYKSPLQLWVEMTADTPENVSDSLPMQIGRGLEAFIGGTLYPAHTGKATTPCSAIYQSSEHDWAIASPDFFVSDGRILETKSTSDYSAHQWEDDAIPNYAHIQTMWQMGICEISTCDVAALIGNRNFVVRTVNFDPEIYANLFSQAETFINLVRNKIPPAARFDDSETVDRLFPAVEGKQIEFGDSFCFMEFTRLNEEIQAVKNRIAPHDTILKGLKKELEAIENNVKIQLGDAELGRIAGTNFAFRKIRKQRKGYTVAPSESLDIKLVEAK